MIYNNIKEYAIQKNISRPTAKKRLVEDKIIKLEIKWKKCIVDVKEMIKYLITKI